MSYPIAPTVLVALVSLTLASLDARLGVDPAFYQLYSQSTIACQGQGRIPISRVNDDYCDCPEKGEDEPGTSACANGTFYCKNIGSKPTQIGSWRVNDGICDCCDGSDEYLGLKTCPSTCEEEGAVFKQRLENLALTIKQGLDKKQKLIISGEALKEKQTNRLAELESQIEAKKPEIENLRRQAETAEEAARVEKESQDAQKKHTEAESSDHIASDAPENNNADARDTGNGADLSTHSSFPYSEEYAYTGNPPDGNPTTEALFPFPEQYAPRNQRADTKHDEEEIAESDETEDEQKEEAEEVVKQESVEPESPIAKAARESRQAFRDAENQLSSLEKEVEDISKMLKIDYGPNGAYRMFQSECFTTTQEKYTYKLCPFKEVLQIESHSTSLGTFQEWGSDHSEWLFDHGQRCWNGPERSVKVKLQCGLKNQIVSVHEPSTCLYEMLFETPAACSHEEANRLQSELRELSQPEHFRDEL